MGLAVRLVASGQLRKGKLVGDEQAAAKVLVTNDNHVPKPKSLCSPIVILARLTSKLRRHWFGWGA